MIAVSPPATGSRAARQSRSFARSPGIVLAATILTFVVGAALLADIVSPYSFTAQDPGRAYEGPSSDHWFGTDQLGRDLLTRLLHGARVSLAVGCVTQMVILLIGVPIGTITGYLGGRVDQLLMRAVDVMYSFPDLLLVIIIMTATRAATRDPSRGSLSALLANADAAAGGLLGVFISLSVISWLTVARLVRGQVLSLREREFIQAARVVGAGPIRIMACHLVPNTFGIILVAAALGIPRAILVEAALSFIGLGVQAPITSWGVMILEGYKALRASPPLLIAPAAALSLTVLACNLIADGLRSRADDHGMA